MWIYQIRRLSALWLAGFYWVLAPVTGAEDSKSELSLPPHPADQVVVSPIAGFRELLSLSPEQEAQALASKSPAQRAVLAEKLEEYRSLPVGVRERRLYTTELSWYLRPLLGMARGSRDQAFDRIPEEFQPAVRYQLEHWDRLPPDLRDDLVTHQSGLRLLSNWQRSTADEQEKMTQRMPPAARERVQRQLAWWESLSHRRQQMMVDQFQKFFTLTPREQQKTLGSVPLTFAEKQQIQATLDEFSKLEPRQRSVCLRSYSRFANLTFQERVQFLRNAELWQAMTPEERRSWRLLLSDIAVLTPPGFGNPPLPPVPGGPSP